jgi:RND family efflux transporter MFP subunit
MTKSSLLIVVAIFAAAALTAINPTHTSAQAKIDSDRPLKSIASASSSPGQQSTKNRANSPAQPDDIVGCLIAPGASSQVAAGSPGVLAEIKVERGDLVTRGQVLAVLDNGVEQALLKAAKTRAATYAGVVSAKASRDMARQKLSRIKRLEALSYNAKLELELAQGEAALAQSRLQLARDEHRASKSDHAVAQSQLQRRQVVSPIDGIVADRLLNPGERADGRPIVHVIQLDSLRVEVILPASKFGKVKPGMTGEVTPLVQNHEEVTGTVEQVDRFIDAASATFRARIAIENKDLSIPAGVRCDVKFAEAT